MTVMWESFAAFHDGARDVGFHFGLAIDSKSAAQPMSGIRTLDSLRPGNTLKTRSGEIEFIARGEP